MLQNEYRSTPLYKKIIIAFTSIILISIQFAIFYLTLVGSIYNDKYLYIRILYFTGIVLGLIVSLLVINFETNSSYKVTWIVLINLLPLFFTYLYILNRSSRKLPKRKQRKIVKYYNESNIYKKNIYDNLTVDELKLATYVASNGYDTLYNNTNIIFFNDAAKKHEHMLNTIKNAKKYIFLEYFIVSDGLLLEELIDTLEERGKAGIEIKFLYDDFGSKRTLSKKTINRLISIPNLDLCVFAPLGFNLNPLLNYRDHRKILIVDGIYAYCGGDNLADEYIHLKQRFGYWRDNACLYEGNAVVGFIYMFLAMWYVSTKESLTFEKYYIEHNISNDSYVLPISSGPSSDIHIAYETFISLINSATKSIYISTPYLIIDDYMLGALIKAHQSGIDVKILTPGVPDKKVVYYITRAHYKTLLEAGIEIYEYTKGFNHAKNIIIDEKMGFCGTVNMDYRSMFLHYECGAVIFRDKVIKEMKDDFLKTTNESKLVTIEEFNNRNILSKFLAFILRIFAPLL